MPAPLTARRTVVVALITFAVLGISESSLGTAWPSLRIGLDRPVEDLGILIAVGAGAYGVASLTGGRLLDRLGTGTTLVAATVVSIAGLAGYTTARSWPVVLAAAVLLGTGGGLVDTTVNAHAAHTFTPGAMNLLHGGFGVGAAFGPIVMAAAIGSSGSPRPGYVFLVLLQSALLGGLVWRRRGWQSVELDERPGQVGLNRIAVLTLAMFFVYTGLEVGAGQWAFSEMTERRGLSVAAAGTWTALFWGGLTIGRIGLGAIATRAGAERVLSIGMTVAIVGAAWFWIVPGGAGAAGLPLLGIGLAGVFPTLVTLTPQRIGRSRTNAMVGYQLAAASAGVVVVPWLIGRLIGAIGLESMPPAVTVTAVTLMLLHMVLLRASPASTARR